MNIQVIDGAENCTYSIFAATPSEFETIFPNETDVEFAEDLFARLGNKTARELLAELWNHPVEKRLARGIHGTLFYQLARKKRFYPTKKEREMVASPPSRGQSAGRSIQKDKSAR